MNIIFGDFIENLPPSQEYLIISFSPTSVPLQKRWRNNGLSADFLADYLSTFFLCDDEEHVCKAKQAEFKSAISYIANELLENGMKYSKDTSTSTISIQLHLERDNIIFEMTNSINTKAIKRFQAYIKELINSDPYEFYMRQLEQNATQKNSTKSGLGFLTMMNDYGAKLGWKFETSGQESKESAVTTMVQLRIDS
ncbi:ATP-binding protein [Pleurocapsales cyanobacterium LEGE 06147]|nr:ATP-binding protein [Pleurocapsales cyanobacterium LEGE 06147]